MVTHMERQERDDFEVQSEERRIASRVLRFRLGKRNPSSDELEASKRPRVDETPVRSFHLHRHNTVLITVLAYGT
jgi:hypothetical protein